MASICSVTFIDPSSAPIPAPIRPLATNPVMMGPISLMMENTSIVGSIALAPNRTRLARDCRDKTTPVAEPASATNGSDLDPSASNWCTNSAHLNESVNIALATRTQNIPSSPNHSIAGVKTLTGLVAAWICGAGVLTCAPIGKLLANLVPNKKPHKIQIVRSSDTNSPRQFLRQLAAICNGILD